MYEQKAALFLYCVSPVHMGAGTAIGAIDNPIQRERHTGHPMMLGSGLKGALRQRCNGADWVAQVFGPETSKASEHAGALSLSDAVIALFPVRSLRGAYVYATSPVALGRLHRTLTLAGQAPAWRIPAVQDADSCLVSSGEVLVDGNLVLEAFQFRSGGSTLGEIASWLADNAFPSQPGFEFFRGKVKSSLVLLHDDRFNHFVRHSTLVEPHVRISDETGTADDGGLFYSENLPPESLLLSLVMASRGRKQENPMAAEQVLAHVLENVDGQMIQVGGNASTGRGQIVARVLKA